MRSLLTRMHREWRVLGRVTLLLPLIVFGTFTGLIALAAFDNLRNGQPWTQVHHTIARELLAMLELGVAPVAGFIAAHIVVLDPVRELHLTFTRAYRATIGLRLTLAGIWVGAVALAGAGIIAWSGYWIVVQPAPLNQLLWFAPLIGMMGIGAALALVLQSRNASAAVLGMLWVGTLFLRAVMLLDAHARYIYPFLTTETVVGGLAPDAPYWLANRLILIAIGCVGLICAAILLQRHERLLDDDR